MLFILPRYAWGDGSYRYAQLTALLEQGAMPDAKYSMIGPILSAPLWLGGRLFGAEEWWCLRYNAFLLIGGVTFFYLALRSRVPRRLLRTFILLLVFGSMFPYHQLWYYGEVFTAILVMTGTIAILIDKVRLGWFTVVIAVASTPATLPALTLLTAHRIWDSRRLRWALAVLAAVTLVMLESWIRRGSPFNTGYDINYGRRTIMPFSGLPGFSYPIFFGLLSLTLSFGKGLLFFAPGLFLPVRSRLKELAGRCKRFDPVAAYELWMAFAIGLILTYATYWSWSGSTFWGPRYLLFASVPASFVLAVRVFRPGTAIGADVITVVALTMSLWAGLNGAVFGDVDTIKVCWPDGKGLYEAPLCYYTPEFSALWYPFVENKVLTTGQQIYLLYGLAVAAYLMWRPVMCLARRAAGLLAPAVVRARTVRW
ncbi:hypothetical protein [Actinomadura latina]|uniref:DUF2029 domain-containing protein n=1 Tax=Actinomadura latina TaxID=163603 RepID=A0A846YRI5_9ACTN|nr:hypothetical protein [Actinomadura latina]NKZ02397.1 hypothetical protein [Actinomadura latina]